MPEGDTIHRTAIRLRPYLVGEQIVRARGWADRIDAESLVGARVPSIEARGKHLLLHLDDGRVIHGHSGMTGSWHLYPLGEPWQKPERRAALVLETDRLCVVFFSPKTLELLTPTQFRRHPYLHRLGPDLLAEGIDFEAVVARFKPHAARPLGEAVMDQTVACGIGNIWKSELLFLSNLDPFAPVGEVEEVRLRQMLELGRELMQHNLEGPGRRTRFEATGGPLWVYGRSGEPCYLCGTPIAMRRQGDLGRSTYYCARCQSTDESE